MGEDTAIVRRSTVLVVEDEPELRTTLLRVLGPTFDVSIADSGLTALERFERGERYDVVICDLFMPKMDGAVFVERLRQLDEDQARRLIVLTGNADTPMAAKLAGHYVVEKPFKVSELRELIERVSAAARNGYFPSVVVVAARLPDGDPA